MVELVGGGVAVVDSTTEVRVLVIAIGVLVNVELEACRTTGRCCAQATDAEPNTIVEPSKYVDHIFN